MGVNEVMHIKQSAKCQVHNKSSMLAVHMCAPVCLYVCTHACICAYRCVYVGACMCVYITILLFTRFTKALFHYLFSQMKQ